MRAQLCFLPRRFGNSRVSTPNRVTRTTPSPSSRSASCTVRIPVAINPPQQELLCWSGLRPDPLCRCLSDAEKYLPRGGRPPPISEEYAFSRTSVPSRSSNSGAHCEPNREANHYATTIIYLSVGPQGTLSAVAEMVRSMSRPPVADSLDSSGSLERSHPVGHNFIDKGARLPYPLES